MNGQSDFDVDPGALAQGTLWLVAAFGVLLAVAGVIAFIKRERR
jgi:hypothetical protein